MLYFVDKLTIESCWIDIGSLAVGKYKSARIALKPRLLRALFALSALLPLNSIYLKRWQAISNPHLLAPAAGARGVAPAVKRDFGAGLFT